MRGISKACRVRWLAAAIMLALIVASTMGAYAHAAGHPLPQTGRSMAAVSGGDDAGRHAHAVGPVATPQPGHMHGGAHDCGDTGPSLECCDILCHGGQAILAPDALVPHPPHGVPVIRPAAAFDGAEPDGLDRPPKAFRSA